MRRGIASFRRVRSRCRFGAVLALVALLAQLVFPGALAFAMGTDPLGNAPICTTGHGTVPGPSHKALHTACPLCQAPAAAWGFLPPPDAPEIRGPDLMVLVVWRLQASLEIGSAVAGAQARGPPGAA
ncbi:MAG TPA: hypothetical protein VGV37_03040 [Aliidongia sp.]|uniref:hypothetical protein n=1 Tax=Aliidongia sp. TaxID=1914230 RepID=UPI002DDD78AD|nr:hypothetical protein [Aliidongia sp.]HEV2673489.1 hypothetical protein [Aliidongia sp.]